MRNIWQKIKAIPFIHKLNTYSFMPIIWWSILYMLIIQISIWIKLSVVLRVGVLFLIIGSIFSYFVGALIKKLRQPLWWMLLLPALFTVFVLLRFAKYNLLIALIFLIIETFGLIRDQLYR